MTELPTEADAVRLELQETVEEPFPPALNFSANDLLEALFLENEKPVVIFDAPDPELISLRILAALWPDIRRRFALSTFALSPRKIGGRDLDLVFAPSNAKAKFSDWPGRRVDGRSSQIDRHRWTGAIVRRVFTEPVPKLLSDSESNLLGERQTSSAAALRIALLWDELLDKLERTPTAALGLLDIANSGMVSDTVAMKSLEPRLAEAIDRAGGSLPPHDAWEFIGAIARKAQGHDMPSGRVAIEHLVTRLAEQDPSGAISLLQQADPDGVFDDFLPNIALGLGNGVAPDVEQMLFEASASTIARLVSQGGALARRIADDGDLIDRMGVVLCEVERKLADEAGMMLLPFLTEDRHLPAAIPIFAKLTPKEIAFELRRLGEANDFQATWLSSELIDRARQIGGLLDVRDILISSAASARRDALLEKTFDAVRDDVLWLLNRNSLPKTTVAALLVGMLRRADEAQFAALFSDQEMGERLVDCLPEDSIDIHERALTQENLPMNAYIRVIQSVIPQVSDARKFDIAEYVLGRCLRNRFFGDEAAVLSMLLGILGARLNGGLAARVGLEQGVSAEIAIRNIIVFEKAPAAARKRIIGAVDEIARALRGRYVIDLSEVANDACAKLMSDAEKVSPKALVDAAGLLMPVLLRARHQPVSPIIAVLFPIIYRELAKSDDVPELLKFIPFFDWDRCKTARNELVNAFMSSSWRAGDLALTACRCNDVAKILMVVAKSYGGEEYVMRIESDLSRLGTDGQRRVKHFIDELRAGRSHKAGGA